MENETFTKEQEDQETQNKRPRTKKGRSAKKYLLRTRSSFLGLLA